MKNLKGLVSPLTALIAGMNITGLRSVIEEALSTENHIARVAAEYDLPISVVTSIWQVSENNDEFFHRLENHQESN